MVSLWHIISIMPQSGMIKHPKYDGVPNIILNIKCMYVDNVQGKRNSTTNNSKNSFQEEIELIGSISVSCSQAVKFFHS